MKQKNYISGTYAFGTDIGKIRLTNEDRANALTNTKGNILLLVCDGMGGANKGDYASSIAIKMISESFFDKQKFLNRFSAVKWAMEIIKKANDAIYQEAQKNAIYQGMGTTLTMVLIMSNHMITAQIGDSRAYVLHDQEVVQITEDQTYVAYLYRTGKIRKEEMLTHPKRHVLTNALGIYPSLNVDIKITDYCNENVLVCSDGLYNNVEDNSIYSILKSDDSTEQKVNELIALANANGGSDNIAIVLWEANK
ncbi:MAG TPA: Stp1/IreP family PP2C-type Ser/Thr phosphatase [Bacilli bacterium]|nr:Stp1/IreP family PP2C-type Ser/Thr phosphatase [Bacilli bacterium]HPS19047.1 Stp1/IreP family PP2C-type Ser/Thr phosphatase [Bacilli bacterium]